MLILAVAGLWPFLRSIGADSWPAVGLVRPSGQGKRLLGGLALGLASQASVALLAVAAGARTVRGDWTSMALLQRLSGALLTAALVGTLEELLFRGAVFGALRKTHHWVTALLVSSVVYSMVHFFERPAAPEHVTWASGLLTLAQMLRGFGQLEMLVPGFFSLLLAGASLAVAFHRTATLYFSIGLHAGWIVCMKLYNHLAMAAPGANTWWWGTGKLVDGWPSLIFLGLVFGVVWFGLPRQEAAADGR